MPEYILLMHADADDDDAEWQPYLAKLQQAGVFEGGSAIGGGVCAKKNGRPPRVTNHLAGYIRINAASLDAAKSFLAGNPVFEGGGTVEIRELTRTD